MERDRIPGSMAHTLLGAQKPILILSLLKRNECSRKEQVDEIAKSNRLTA
jgi:hypothetical protein